MSNALAIAGVTAVLRDRLNDGLVNHNVAGVLGSTVTVSVMPPDRVVPTNGTESSQLNLFLYNVTPNLGWRNEGLPSRDPGGQHRLTNPPLALDLHYLLSSYSGGDLHAEILLGYAVQLMHEFPVITRAMIRTALNPSPDVGADLPPALRALADSGLADQVESLRITPQYLNTEEISKLWTATQASYRPTAAYQVSVVLIEATKATHPTLPVLTRGEVDPVSKRDRGVIASPALVPPLPGIEAVVPADKQPVVRLGHTVTLSGHHLDGLDRQVRLRSDRFDIDETLAASGTNADDHMDLVIPAARATDFPVGVYDVTARLIPPGESSPRETNRLACVIAPDITNLPQTVARDGGGNAHITIDFTPELRPGQTVSLLLGQEEISPETFAAPTGTLNFIARNAQAGALLARLRIDGVDSPIVDRAAEPPVFLDQRVTIT
jgi:Pvc16 N-terminal domain